MNEFQGSIWLTELLERPSQSARRDGVTFGPDYVKLKVDEARVDLGWFMLKASMGPFQWLESYHVTHAPRWRKLLDAARWWLVRRAHAFAEALS